MPAFCVFRGHQTVCTIYGDDIAFEGSKGEFKRGSKVFKSVQKGSNGFKSVQKGSKGFKSVQKGSKVFKKVQKGSKGLKRGVQKGGASPLT